MHTATHTTHQLATFHVEAAERHAEAAAHRQLRGTRQRSTRTIAGVLTAIVVGTTLAASPATAADGYDTYTGGGKAIQGLVDGWFDPTASQPASLVPSNVR